MKQKILTICIFVTFALQPASLMATETIHHDLKVRLDPGAHHINVRDEVTLPSDHPTDLEFHLHRGLAPSSPTPGVQVVRISENQGSALPESYRMTLPGGTQTFVLNYSGTIHHPVESYGREQARGFRETPGIITEEGIYLSGSSFWYPRFEQNLLTFALEVELPGGWDGVSQGERALHLREEKRTTVRWESPEPQDEIFLIAAIFTEYEESSGPVPAMVFLRTPDPELANKYLEATNRYVAMYEKLIGPYPYKKFALVENFWETGYGMPSFTLLGPKVIRFPFILHSSFPHEILHNWWGNSVFPEMMKGNWSEGLTAYLSDHLIKEQRGKGVDYRQATLQKYADYVSSERDFPLTQFRSRHSSPSEAVGYGKSLMFFHMLRQALGDETFVQGLQEFYLKNRFQFASFEDLRTSFESVSGKELVPAFNQWIKRTGAPELKISHAQARAHGDGYLLTTLIEQVQAGEAYDLQIPVAVTLEGQERSFQTTVFMEKKHHELNLRLPARPLRLDVDPEFDLFRRLGRDEIPPALSQALGSKKMLILVPSSADIDLLNAYQDLARSLGQSGPDDVEVLLDQEVKVLPEDRAVTLLGWENRFLPEMAPALSGYETEINEKGVTLGKREILRKDHSVVLTIRHPKNREHSLTWIATDLSQALPGLARKLPHYHKYSYLGFQGKEPDNVAKGRWPVLASPMTIFVPGKNGTADSTVRGKMAQRVPLAALPPAFSYQRMMETVRFLASPELRGRGVGTEGLDRAAEYIAGEFRKAGLQPAGDPGADYYQTWVDREIRPEGPVILRNVVGVIPGEKPEFRTQSVVVGAHYDHLGLGWPDVREGNQGKVHFGADDNASGMAVLIELARILSRSLKPDRSVVFAAFTGEEAGKIGSRHYVTHQKLYPVEACMGMVNIDTVGRLGEQKLLILGAGSAREWIHIFRGTGYVTGVDLETVNEELDSSDQKSFHEAGVPAVQLFSGPHLDYHCPSDTVEKIDTHGLVKVASVAREVVEYLAEREEPLTTSLKAGQNATPEIRRGRDVSLGTIPDFAYEGEGCRISGVVPDMPAESCGLMEGDVIIRINADAVQGLKDLSRILKSLSPGDRISITFIREGKEMTVETEVVQR